MTHPQATDELLERAALHALGALVPEEAAAFEAHLAEGCRTCQAEMQEFAAVVGQLGYAAQPESPRREVRDRLLTYALAGLVQGAWTVTRATEGEWEPAPIGGLMVKRLFRDPAAKRSTALVRMEPGVRYPSHRHADTEELYMLGGDLMVEGQVLRAGDYCAAIGQTVHGTTYSEGGCTFVLHASEQDQIAEEGQAERPQSGLVFVRSTEGAWGPGPAEGVERRRLFSDPASGTSTYLVRMRPGRHERVSAEQVYMLEGDGHVSGIALQAGDYYRAATGTVPDVSYTERGCTFLVISSHVEPLE